MEQHEELLGIVWAIVLVQGAITLLSLVEAFVAGAAQGIPLLPIVLITGGGAVLALASARGIRRKKRWARRVTLIAESLILGWGAINVLLSMGLAGHVNLMSFLATIVAPMVVIVLLRRTKPLFARPAVEGAG